MIVCACITFLLPMQVCIFNLIAAAQESLQEQNALAETGRAESVSLWDEMQQVVSIEAS